MLKKALIYFFVLAFIPNLSFSQKTLEGGLFFGRAYYIGEINPKTHYGNNAGTSSFGGVLRYNLNKRYSLKATLIKTTLKGDDENVDLQFSKFRNASFETSLWDFSTTIEFNFLPFEQGSKKHFFTPYLFVGLSVYKFDPSTEVNGVEITSPEAEGGTKIALPFGPGLKVSIKRKLGLAFEWGFRKTTSDVLDGLPNRVTEGLELGKPYDNDWYVLSGFTLTYRITAINPCPYYGF